VRFLIDNQLPSALAGWLRERGHEAEHVLNVGLAQAKDTPVWQHAQDQGAVLITKDEDFADRARQCRKAPVVVWLRVGNSSNRALRQWFMPQLPQIITWIEEGVRVLEIR